MLFCFSSLRRHRRAVCVWLSLALLSTSTIAADKRKVILDDDGFALAQFMVLQSPDADVLGVTIVSGNTWRDLSVARALRSLEIIERSDVPVVPGAIYPLLNSEEQTARWEALYGKLVWKGAWMKAWVEDTEQSTPPYLAVDEVPDLPEGNPSTLPAAEHAATFMIRMVRKYPGEVSIIATGPLTNLALAQSLDPEFASLAKELIYMGGSLNPHQVLDNVSAEQFAREFVNTPRHEFNFFWDPEAARIALRAPWKKIVMVPVDPSTATQLTPKLLKAMSRSDTPLAKNTQAREPGFPLWDEIATGIWLDPSLIADSQALYVDVVTDFGANYGNTLSWSPHYEPGLGEQLNTVVRAVDVKKLEKLMIKLMNAETPR